MLAGPHTLCKHRGMSHTRSDLEDRYQTAAPKWSDKMRVLGYYDGYLGFLSNQKPDMSSRIEVIDIGTGTGAMAEAWTVIYGTPDRLVLLDPSPAMLDVAKDALMRRGVRAETCDAGLEEGGLGSFDVLLAAHVIEHFDDPLAALKAMRSMARPGAYLWMSVSKPHWCNAIIWLQWRHRTFRPQEMTELLQKAGFSVEAQYTFPSGPPSRTSFGIVARAV
ncbi:class I SAM-dependent methyltransferase [uncultured Roseobacter sp.]|uniref:class I SAM-dependent methyltransferase n=1 Tax=uncultured Roseobacter sp. TaxID=114847 RepID=UPI00262D75CD|nr:class I SAM-dependent methyltransferase [uncultured Roseobacter sp.]